MSRTAFPVAEFGGPGRSLTCRFPSRLRAVDSACAAIRRLLEQCGAASACFGMDLVARECLNNAVLHGNRRDVRKSIDLAVTVGRRWIRLQVADEGPGFSWRRRDRQAVPGESATHGRGLTIMTQYSDRIRYNQAGNRITLWLKKPSH